MLSLSERGQQVVWNHFTQKKAILPELVVSFQYGTGSDFCEKKIF